MSLADIVRKRLPCGMADGRRRTPAQGCARLLGDHAAHRSEGSLPYSRSDIKMMVTVLSDKDVDKQTRLARAAALLPERFKIRADVW